MKSIRLIITILFSTFLISCVEDATITEGYSNVVAFEKEGNVTTSVTMNQDTAINDVKIVLSGNPNETENYIFSITSSNQDLLPDENIILSGSGKFRSLTITPLAGQVGETVLTGTITDAITGDVVTGNLTLIVWAGLYNVKLQVGAADTLVDIEDASAQGLEFYRSRELNCDLANYASCNNGQLDIIDNAQIIDTALTLDTTAYYVLKRENGDISDVSTVSLATSPFPPGQLIDHAMAEYNGKLWLVGGWSHSSSAGNEVWMSEDGFSWELVTDTPAFGDAVKHELVVFQNKLWLIGGNSSVWNTTDGITWSLVTSTPEFGKTQHPINLTYHYLTRENHQALVFDNKIWVIGGLQSVYIPYNESVATTSEERNDVWYSSDGVTWIQATDNAEFSPRYSHQSVVYDGKMWVTGGWDGSRYDDVWYSYDGASWQMATNAASFGKINNHEMFVFDNKMWVIGGLSDNLLTDNIYTSTDGANWTLYNNNPGFDPRQEFDATIFSGKMWVGGGHNATEGDLWSSDNGLIWRRPLETVIGNFTQ